MDFRTNAIIIWVKKVKEYMFVDHQNQLNQFQDQF